MIERGYNVGQRDFNMSKRGAAWLKRGTTRAGMLKMPACDLLTCTPYSSEIITYNQI